MMSMVPTIGMTKNRVFFVVEILSTVRPDWPILRSIEDANDGPSDSVTGPLACSACNFLLGFFVYSLIFSVTNSILLVVILSIVSFLGVSAPDFTDGGIESKFPAAGSPSRTSVSTFAASFAFRNSSVVFWILSEEGGLCPAANALSLSG